MSKELESFGSEKLFAVLCVNGAAKIEKIFSEPDDEGQLVAKNYYHGLPGKFSFAIGTKKKQICKIPLRSKTYPSGSIGFSGAIDMAWQGKPCYAFVNLVKQSSAKDYAFTVTIKPKLTVAWAKQPSKKRPKE